MTEFIKYFTRKKAGYSNIIADGRNPNELPNCTAIAWGLFYYMHGQRKDWSKRPRGDANTIYESCKKDGSGFWVSKAVKENSILCFNIGQRGHVVYCLGKLAGDGPWWCVESNYSGKIKNGTYIRTLLTDNPAALYKNYQGCVYDFTD